MIKKYQISNISEACLRSKYQIFSKLWLLVIGACLAFGIWFLLFSTLPSALAIGEASPAGKTANVSFPIAELGNCENLGQCKQYCSDEVNKEACIEYAKKGGFYKITKKLTSSAMILAAKSQLGCSSEEECKAVCEKQENREKCKAFAQKSNLKAKSEKVKSLIESAKSLLGCNSEETCKKFCAEENNKLMCAQIAALAGAKGGFKDAFCTKNPGKCTGLKELKEIREASKAGNLSLITQKLEQYCKEYPKLCGSLIKPPPSTSSATQPPPASTSAVQGVSTQKGLLQSLWDFLSSLW